MKNKVIRFMLILIIMSFFMFGCGKTEVSTDTNTEKEEVVEEAPETAETDETQKEAAETTETDAEEGAYKEQAETPSEEAAEGPEAEITAEIKGIEDLDKYMAEMDTKTPHIVIYNEAAGYLIDMKDGESHHLKENDRIFLNTSLDMYAASYTIPEKSKETSHLGRELIPDYTQFEDPHKCIYVIYLKENPDTPIYITCYLYAPE